MKLIQFLKSANNLPLLIVGQAAPEEILGLFKVHPADSFLVEDEIKIEQVRELIKWLSYKPLNSQQKIVIINSTENLNLESANTLLKTLEEPPPYGRIFLITQEERKILPTIVSRCQKIRLPSSVSPSANDNFPALSALSKMSIKERFDWVAAFLKDNDPPSVKQLLTFWQEELRQKLLAGYDTTALLSQISQAKDLLSTNISLKLLLENLLLNLHDDQN